MMDESQKEFSAPLSASITTSPFSVIFQPPTPSKKKVKLILAMPVFSLVVLQQPFPK